MSVTHCAFCGGHLTPAPTWPRPCLQCGRLTYRNPLPIGVALLPIDTATGRGLLTIRRAIAPQRGQLALPGGFLEVGETWQAGIAREVGEEVGVSLTAEAIQLFDLQSTPDDKLLIFGLAPTLPETALPPFVSSAEVSERVVALRPRPLAFPLHTQLLARYLQSLA